MKPGTIQPPPSQQRLEKLARYFRVIWPSDYLLFLKSYNGGEPEFAYFPFRRNDRVIEFFLPILDDIHDEDGPAWKDVAVVITEIEGRLTDTPDILGNPIIPIAHLFAGDFLCLDFRKSKDRPVVAVWDHEQSGKFSPVLYPVADSFGEFLKLVKNEK
jgi:hypothetical protein